MNYIGEIFGLVNIALFALVGVRLAIKGAVALARRYNEGGGDR